LYPLLRIRRYVTTSIDLDFGRLPRALPLARLVKVSPFAQKELNKGADGITIYTRRCRQCVAYLL